VEEGVFFSRIVRRMAIIDGVLERSKDALRLLFRAPIDEHRKTSSPRWCDCPPGRRSAPVESERRRGVTAAASIVVIAFDNDDKGCPDEGRVLGCRDPVQVTAVTARRVPGLDLRRRGTACGGGVRRWRAAVASSVAACGSSP
jgi:hypothetical protein